MDVSPERGIEAPGDQDEQAEEHQDADADTAEDGSPTEGRGDKDADGKPNYLDPIDDTLDDDDDNDGITNG